MPLRFFGWRSAAALLAALLLAHPAAAGEPITIAPGMALDEPALQALVRQELAASRDGDWQVRILQPALPLGNPSAAPVLVTLRADQPAPGASGGPRLTGWLAVQDGTGHVGRLRMVAVLDEMVTVPVPVEALPAGALVTPERFRMVPWPLQRLDPDALRSLAELDGMEVVRRLPADRPVLRNGLQPPRMVRRGESVRISFVRGGLRLSVTGTALDDGALGA
ncbi:flagellar basal body P-ring formation chaperone FlgA, partial [Geminicoccus flavidas]|uniref:flagellar basal body P-ring formation chaperone FlgA n=1 Tax=Geminicoccus flavidas TaxID=2506407 RepID=UPI00135CA681